MWDHSDVPSAHLNGCSTWRPFWEYFLSHTEAQNHCFYPPVLCHVGCESLRQHHSPPSSPRPHHNLLALFVTQGFHSSLDDVGTTSRAAWISGYSSSSPLAPVNAHLISHNPLGAVSSLLWYLGGISSLKDPHSGQTRLLGHERVLLGHERVLPPHSFQRVTREPGGG